jgi:O-antigen ligase
MFSFFSKCNTFISKGLILKKTLISFIIAVLILNTAFFLFFWVNEFSFIDTIKYFSYLVDHRFDKYSIHPIYLSIYLCLGILFSFHILQGSCNSRQRIFILILVLIQGLFLFVLNKKGPIISLFIGLSSIYLFKRDKVKTKYLLIFITGLILIGMLQKKKTISHFKELFKIENINKGNVTSTNIRYTIYLYSLEAVKSKPFLGYGIGDLNNTLMEIYEGQSDLLYKGKFNTHNQYLSFIVSSGVLGLIIFLLSIFFLFRNAIKKSNFLLVTVLIFYLCQMLSENILERENGVIFYSFFISFFQIIESKNST